MASSPADMSDQRGHVPSWTGRYRQVEAVGRRLAKTIAICPKVINVDIGFHVASVATPSDDVQTPFQVR
jgi:hypothetical protein